VLTFSLVNYINHHALTPDFSQHEDRRAVNQYIGNKVTCVTYLKK